MKFHKNLFRSCCIILAALLFTFSSLKAQNGFTMQRWTGAWGSDGPIFTGDLNGDRRTDVFMWRKSDNSWTVNLSSGSGFAMQRWTGAWGSDGPINTGDLNGDGKTDVFMWRGTDNSWTINLSTGTGFVMQRWTGAWGSDGPINTGDLNGDGKTDVFMWRKSDNSWTINLSTGAGFVMQRWTGAWGSDGPINTGDLNGDGKTDVFMWRNSDKSWTVNLSTGTGFAMQRWTGAWGSDGSIHVGDLNGDGKTDVFMWRQSDNSWTVNLSNGNGFMMQRWIGGCKNNWMDKTADLNGDGRVDVAIWNDANKKWIVNYSMGSGFNIQELNGAWGTDGPINVGDLNGDRKTDIFMWRVSDNSWTINLSPSISLSGIASRSDCAKNESVNFTFLDISPDTKNGSDVVSAYYSTAGLIANMAGDKNGLYGVSMNAGVWKTEINQDRNFSKWRQLQNSPRYASCIASDPQFTDHIAVGERDGDATNFNDNHCGLWESFDGGQTFDPAFYFDPAKEMCKGNIVSQAITSVIITDKSTTLAASPCGIIRREYLLKEYTTVLSGNISAITNYQELIVARSLDSIYISTDDGKTWNNRYVIRTLYGNSRYTLNGRPIGMYNEGYYSLAVIRTESGGEFIYVPATRSVNDPNMCAVLIFNNQSKTWVSQDFAPGLGSGLGGRVFIKSFYLNVNNLSASTGGKSQLIFSAAQDLLKANSINADGTVVWELFASSGGSDAPQKKFHSDIWDFHIDPVGWYVWVSNDGGVYYQKLNENDQSRLKNLNAEKDWFNLNEGLHTHHIHAVVAASGKYAGEIYNNNQPVIDKVSYSTSDNQAWKNGSVSTSLSITDSWEVINGMGDVNYSFMDCNNPYLTLNVRVFEGGYASLDDFDNNAPAGSSTGGVNLSQKIRTSGQQGFHFIQTLNNESLPQHLDALMLVNLPLTFGPNRQNVNGTLGMPTPGNRPAIIRNKAFAKNPSTVKQNVAGWEILFNDLPEGASGFWVSGGHQNPTIYVLNSESGGFRIYKRKVSESSWQPMPQTPSAIIGQAQFGPVFVNPFDPDMVYVSCNDGVYLYNKAQNSFIKDNILTNKISDNGKYPISRLFGGGNADYVILGSRANTMGPVSCMTFNPNAPDQVACSSPFTGIFFKNGTQDWNDLTYLLPKPYTPISSITYTSNGIYIATEGRGIFLLKSQ